MECSKDGRVPSCVELDPERLLDPIDGRRCRALEEVLLELVLGRMGRTVAMLTATLLVS